MDHDAMPYEMKSESKLLTIIIGGRKRLTDVLLLLLLSFLILQDVYVLTHTNTIISRLFCGNFPSFVSSYPR